MPVSFFQVQPVYQQADGDKIPIGQTGRDPFHIGGGNVSHPGHEAFTGMEERKALPPARGFPRPFRSTRRGLRRRTIQDG